jgi:hypothetical protein
MLQNLDFFCYFIENRLTSLAFVLLDLNAYNPANGPGPNWGFLQSKDAVPFIVNHDTERHGPVMNYKWGDIYASANAFMLAWPYGSPMLLSGFQFVGKFF